MWLFSPVLANYSLSSCVSVNICISMMSIIFLNKNQVFERVEDDGYNERPNDVLPSLGTDVDVISVVPNGDRFYY